MDAEAIAVLQKHLPGQSWQVQMPRTGWRKPCFIAASGADKYFLKFDVPVAVLKRLGEIGVAPRVLFSGDSGGVSYVIQEFLGGIHPPSQRWMRQHAGALAAVLKLYHEDRQLRAQLAQAFPTDLGEHLARDLDWLSGRFRRSEAGYLCTAEVRQGFARLLDVSGSLLPEPLVPVHNDPSPTNILWAGSRLVLLDWDEITLSDPMRDTGVLLWWNFPPRQWHAFFSKYGVDLSRPRRQKVYWFAARASLDIAIWHAEHGIDGSGFAEDFLAAVNEGPNPKGY